MTDGDKVSYIRNHLQHELHFLLSAVELWRALKIEDAGFIVNIARDSVCVHFRNLIKFFTASGVNDVSITKFIDEPLMSTYKRWIDVIDEAILHLSPKRSNPKHPSNDSNDLNDQMENFRIEILRLWEEFTQKASDDYKIILMQELNRANKEVCDDITCLRKLLVKSN